MIYLSHKTISGKPDFKESKPSKREEVRTQQPMDPPIKDKLVEWKHLIGQHLGRSYTKRSRQLLLDLLCVDCGLKPALLLDFSVPSAECLHHLLDAATKTGVLTNKLLVLTIDMDMLVISPDAFDNSVDIFACLTFVDVSASQEHPCVISGLDDRLLQTRTAFSRFLAEKDKCTACMELPIERDSSSTANPSTLFGVLLGYPVVYYYNTSLQCQDNCLSMVPLIHFVVSGLLGQSVSMGSGKLCQKHIIFSFSVPELFVDLLPKVEAWYKDRKDSRIWCGLFQELQLERNVVNLPSVCL